jgi:hypothetical protein
MKRVLTLLGFVFCLTLPTTSHAQDPFLEMVKGATKKIIKAVDLMVQRLQNETIWLQNAQKTIENILNETKLKEISGWVEKHKEQYAQYYNELQRVKSLIETYKEVKGIIDMQIFLVNEYKTALSLFKGDSFFSVADIDYMERVYSGIFDQSLKNLDQLTDVVHSFTFQMTDQERLAIIKDVKNQMAENLSALRAFTNSNKMLRINKIKDQREIKTIKAYYGIN